MVSEGFHPAQPYLRAGSRDPRAAFIFEGVGTGTLIGEEGLILGGAARFEIDRADATLGTPPHALLLASATGFSDAYQRVIEEVPKTNSLQGGSVCSYVRSDMVFSRHWRWAVF